MRFYMKNFAMLLLTPVVAAAQVQIDSVGAPVREIASPMVATIPLEREIKLDRQSGVAVLFRTEELATTICDAVAIRLAMAQVEFNAKHTKGNLTIFVQTYTKPPQDKMAYVIFQVRNDDEILNMKTPELPFGKGVTIKINAEEKKHRSENKRVRIDPEQLDRILAGENPRVIIKMKVNDN